MTVPEATRRALGILVSAWLVAQLGGGSTLGGAAIGGGGSVTRGASVGRGAAIGEGEAVSGTAGGVGASGSPPFGGTTTYGGATLGPRPIDQLDRAVRQPLPALPPVQAPRPDAVWVPDRFIDRPDGTFHVPGHWERPVNAQQRYVPPLTVCKHGSGECTQVPAGVRPLPEVRTGP